MDTSDISFMLSALEEAQLAASKGEVPIGSVLVQNNEIIARGHNLREINKNPLHHAEMLVLESAAQKLGNWRLENSTLYVTLEPCPMCLGALLQARVGTLVYGCADNKKQPVASSITGNNHTLQIRSGILQEKCAQILKDFFKARRANIPAARCGFPNDF